MKFILGNKILLLKIMKEEIKKIKKKNKKMMKKNKMKMMIKNKINNNKFKMMKKMMMIN